MAISRQGTPTLKEQASGTSIIVNVPASVATGEVLVAALILDSGTATDPANWTRIAAVTGSGGFPVVIGLYHVVTNAGGEPASYTWTALTSGRQTGIMERYSGVDNVNVIDVAASTANPASGAATIAIPSITTVTDGAMLISAAGENSGTTGSTTAPGTMSMVSQSTGTGKRGGMADETFATAGATGTRTWTFSSTSLTHAGFLGALRPAVAVVAKAPQQISQYASYF